MKDYWGIDLGGTKIEGVVFNYEGEIKLLSRERIPTEREKGYRHILKNICELLNQLKKKTGKYPSHIGMGTPGTLDPITGLIKNSNTLCLNGKPLKKDIEDITQLSFEIANDANCFALAEAKLGIVKDVLPSAKIIFGVILGTGVGGGLVVNGKVINGRQGIGGEWGHNFLHESGGKCYCGKTGCVETIISGTGLERYYFELSGRIKPLKDIVKSYQGNNDFYAKETVNRLLEYFAFGISYIINIIDPDAIIIGGGVGNIDLLYSEGIERVKKYVFNDRLDTKFLKPKLGDSAGVFGAALLVDN